MLMFLLSMEYLNSSNASAIFADIRRGFNYFSYFSCGEHRRSVHSAARGTLEGGQEVHYACAAAFKYTAVFPF